MLKKYFLFAFLIFLSFSSCKKEDEIVKPLPTISDGDVQGDLKINQLQYLSSHNCYRIKTDEDILNFIFNFAHLLPAEYNPIELDYTHIPIKDQLTIYGVRHLEIDIYLDPNGGKFYNRKGNVFGDRPEASGIQELLEPGIKILHIADIDFNTHHYSFKNALQNLKDWSQTYPEHLPIYIQLELSTKGLNVELPNVGFAEPEAWDNLQKLLSIEEEILNVFSRDELIIPDDIRGNFSTLNEAVLNSNWPTIDEARGKFVFVFNEKSINSIYTANAPSLENRLIFTEANPGDDHAAFLIYNDVMADFNLINQYSAEGYMIRTRVDGGTYEARNNDYSKWIQALQSGAHFLSTDYYKADERAGDGTWSSYEVSFDNKLYNINPITGQ